jgi:ectoine hydroxylase-related dioxygenase (phytanoyl-CoA dioxygenase family)
VPLLEESRNWTLAEHGACHLRGAASGMLDALEELSEPLSPARAGHRLEGNAILRVLAGPGSLLQQIAAERIGSEAHAVRALFFNKSDDANWALGWHQDRTIAVMERHAMDGFGPWTVKAGIPHVAPPIALLAGMLTMRVHLDAVPQDNAPLLIAPGSHRLGAIAEGDIPATVARCGTQACLAERGDIWLYATPILHASDRAKPGYRRRVLQLDFAASALPAPLEWRGI